MEKYDSQSTLDKYSTALPTLGRVGIVTNSFSSTYYSQLVEAASNYLLHRGFHVVVQSNLRTKTGELQALASLKDNACDGFILHAGRLSADELHQLTQSYPNIVLLNCQHSLCQARSVNVDNKHGGRIAARHLIESGHRAIATVRGPKELEQVRQRADGFREELKASDLEPVVEIDGDFLQLTGLETMEQILNEYKEVSAVFFHNDEMALGALLTCRRLGVRVPQDISIIGYDGTPICEYVSPRLTTVQQPLRQLGEHAARIVCDLLLHVDENSRTAGAAYQPVLAERESVAAPSGQQFDDFTLTQREIECLTWTAQGKTSWEISVILGVSESTATFHLRNAGTKLKASNRAHAIAKALHLGLIQFDPV